MAKYTIQVPVMITLVIEADSVTEALDSAAEELHNAVIEMDREYGYNENWEDAEVFNEDGDLVEEE
jgi:hypothetical protein